jgi:chromosome segregation ATPase
MAAVAAAPGLPASRLSSAPEVPLSTLSDPRSPPPANQWSNGTSTPHHPDLNSEVAALSDKLINAINHQTSLDDTLAATRHELEEAREKINQLESEAQLQREHLTSGIMVKRTDVDQDLVRVTNELAEEKTLRSKAEKEKRGMEQELENLTASLFEEANKVNPGKPEKKRLANHLVDGRRSEERAGSC